MCDHISIVENWIVDLINNFEITSDKRLRFQIVKRFGSKFGNVRETDEISRALENYFLFSQCVHVAPDNNERSRTSRLLLMS